MRTTLLKSILLALVCEAICMGLLMHYARFGICNVLNLSGALLMHYITPGACLAEFLHIPEPWAWVPIIAVHIIFWSCVWLGIFGIASGIRSNNAAIRSSRR